MKSMWWFRLYTRPFLRLLGILLLIGLMGDCVLTRVGYFYGGTLLVIPLFALMSKFSLSFRENIEFHKGSVPFKDLRRAFLADVFITGLCYLFLFFMLPLVSKVSGGHFSLIDSDLMRDLTLAMRIYYSLFLFFAVAWVCFIAIDKRYVFYGLKHRTFWESVAFVGTIWALGILQLIVVLFMGFEVTLGYTFLLGSLFVGSSLFYLKAMFHRGPTHASLWNWLKHYGLGTLTFSAVFSICLLIGRKDVFDERLSDNARIDSFQFYGYFSPKLDEKSFRLLEPNMGSLSKWIVYKSVEFDPSRLGVDFYLKDTQDKTRLMQFLKYRKPSKDFLLSLYSHMGDHPEYWRKVPSAEWIRHSAFYHWPKGQVLPDKFLAEKKKADEQKRGVASGR